MCRGVGISGMRRLLAIVTLTVILVAGACGGGGSSKATADRRGADTSGAAKKDPEESMLAFARCMREHGVDMPDPEFGEGGRVQMRIEAAPGQGVEPMDEDFQAASKECGGAFGMAGAGSGGGAFAVPFATRGGAE